MEKKIVLITGGSSGIGLETAKQLLREGAQVIICGRSDDKLIEAKKLLPDVDIFRCDVTSDENRRALVGYIENKYNALHILINNAGIAHRYMLEKTSDLSERTRTEMEINYIAPVILSQLFLPLLIPHKGTIVNTCSGLSFLPLSFEPNYCASKAALHSMTLSMRFRYAKVGVRVVAIYYPEVNTPFQQGHSTPNALSPQTAVTEALKQLKKGKESIYVKRAKMLFLLSRLIPGKALKTINNFLDERVEKVISE